MSRVAAARSPNLSAVRLPSPVAAVATAVALAALAPLAFVAWAAVQTGPATARALIARPRVGELLVNTLLLEVLAVPISAGLALALAWLTERTDLPGARLWGALAAAPLAVPAFVQSYAWISLVPALHGLPAAVLVASLAYLPFLYLPVAAQLRRLDPALEEAAASLGHGPWAVFGHAVLPQLRLALCGGALLVGLHLLAEYGLFAMIRFDTFATAIVDQFQSAYNGPAASMLAGVLAALCFGLVALERLARGEARYARLGAGAARVPCRRRLGRMRLPALALPALVTALALGVPFVTLARWLAAGGAEAWARADIPEILGRTAGLAAMGAALSVLAAFPMAWLSVRRPGRLQRALEACHTQVGALPGVIVALAIVWITVRVALPLYQTTASLLAAYALLFLPRALVGVRASLAQVPAELEDAARALGRPPAAAWAAVTLRLAAPGIAASLALAGLGITTELTATLLLAPNGTRTLATEFWSMTSELDYAAAAPYAATMVLLSLPMVLWLDRESRRAAGR